MTIWEFKVRIKGESGEVEMSQILNETATNKVEVRQGMIDSAIKTYKELVPK